MIYANLDCIPVVSTLTNGAELIYRLAHKVHTAADSITPGWKTSFKIHALSKDALDYLPIIPILGNLFHIGRQLIQWALGYKKIDPLEKAIRENNSELALLELSQNPIETTKRFDTVIKAIQNPASNIFKIACAHRYNTLLKKDRLLFAESQKLLLVTCFPEEDINALLDKTQDLDLVDNFKNYLRNIAKFLPHLKKDPRILPYFYTCQGHILNRMISTVAPEYIGDYLGIAIKHVGWQERLLRPIIRQYESNFTPEQRATIFKNAIPSPHSPTFSKDLLENRAYLMEWAENWTRAIPPQETQAIFQKICEGEKGHYTSEKAKKVCLDLKQPFLSKHLVWTQNGPLPANNSASAPTGT